jgi:hypothetical protein
MSGSLRRRAHGAVGLVLGLMIVGRTELAVAEPSASDSGSAVGSKAGPEAGPRDERSADERPEIRRPARPRPRWRDASPRERRARREALQGLLLALPDARPGERLAIIREAAVLPREERLALRERLRRYEALAPDERRAVDETLGRLRARAGDDVERFERNLGRWEKLSEADRERYREQMRRLREMSVEERRQLLDDWERSGRGRRGGPDREEDGAVAPDGSTPPDGSGASGELGEP